MTTPKKSVRRGVHTGPADKTKKASRPLDFLVQLAKSKKVQASFERDPHAAMKAANLNSKERKALLSGDSNSIRKVMPGSKIHLPPNTTIKVTLIVIKF